MERRKRCGVCAARFTRKIAQNHSACNAQLCCPAPYPINIEDILAKFMGSMPKFPMPYEPSYPYAPGGPAEDPGPLGGPY